MKHLLFLSLLTLIFITSCSRRTTEPPVLTIYAYDSFSTEWGLEPVVIPPFENICKCEVQVINVPDGASILNRLVIEGKETKADLVIGLDNNLSTKALELDLFEPYKPKNSETVPPELWFDESNRLIPFDYGYLAIVYDSEKLLRPPRSFNDLTSPLFRKKIIIEDPRTSTVGLGFLFWSTKISNSEYSEFWKKFKKNVLTITPSLDRADTMFKKGEAPMVISYTTSHTFHVINENSQRYKAAIFPEGHYVQIEAAGIVKGGKNRDLARAFMDYMLSAKFQGEIPTKNFMYPVVKDVVLPEAFETLPRPKKMLMIPEQVMSKKLLTWIDGWHREMQ